jgi:hypothetical protein
MSGVMVQNSGFTSLPLHRNWVVLSNRELTDLSSNSVLGPLGEGCLSVDIELKVDQGFWNSGVDEQHAILFDVRDQLRGRSGIEP